MDRPDMVSGRPAATWLHALLTSLPACLIGLLGVPGAALATASGTSARDAATALFVIIGVAGGLSLIVTGLGLAAAMRREAGHGYSTLLGNQRSDLWLLNARDGSVARPPATDHN